MRSMMLKQLRNIAALLVLHIALIGTPLTAGDTTGLVIPSPVEVPSKLGFKINRDVPDVSAYDDVRLFRDGDWESKREKVGPSDRDQSKKPETPVDFPQEPRLTHPDFPGLVFEGLGDPGDLGRRLAKLREPIRGPPVILNLSGHASEGAQMLNRLTDQNNRLRRFDAGSIEDIDAINFSSLGHRYPIVFAHLETAPDGRPLLGNPDSKNLLEWSDVRRSFDEQRVSPIIIACKSECLKGADFGTLSDIDVNEVELAFKDLHKAKNLGELLTKLSSASAEGIVVRVSKANSGRVEVVVAGRGHFDAGGVGAGDLPPRLADAGSGGRRPRGPNDGDGDGGEPKSQPHGMSILIYAAFPVDDDDDEDEAENAKLQ